MSKGINIKVSKDKLLGALEEKLRLVQTTQAEYEHQLKISEEEEKDYKEQVKKIVASNPQFMGEVAHNWRGNGNVFEIVVEIPQSLMPAEVQTPTKPYGGGRGYGRNYVSNDYDDIVADLTNAIRMLKLSDEDVVSTATYASVSRYL
jgi:hypothetical protein